MADDVVAVEDFIADLFIIVYEAGFMMSAFVVTGDSGTIAGTAGAAVATGV